MERENCQPRCARSGFWRKRTALCLLSSRVGSAVYPAALRRNGYRAQARAQASHRLGGRRQTVSLRVLPGRFRIDAKTQGLPVDYINHNDLKEMPRLRGSASAITLVNKAPHPNAAKVFINWFLSRRGQIVYQESHGDRDSLRIDIPKEKVPAAQRRVAGRKYFFVETPEFMDVKPAMKIVEDALAGKGR